jgi:hypothetical protein
LLEVKRDPTTMSSTVGWSRAAWLGWQRTTYVDSTQHLEDALEAFLVCVVTESWGR